MRTNLLYGLMVSAAAAWLAACNTSSPPAGSAQQAVAVEVLDAAYASVTDRIEAPGSVQPRNRFTLSAQINGFVREVAVRAGDTVPAGRLLASLDARDADSQKAAAAAAIQEARAALEEARKSAETSVSMRNAAQAAADLANATLERYQKLYATRSVSPQELDEVKARRETAVADLEAKQSMVEAARDRLDQITARIAQAEAQAERADVVLGWTRIAAPSSARIAQRLVDPGSAIFPGSPLFVLESLGTLQVLADLPTQQSRQLHRGLEVEVRDPGQADPLPGHVVEINPVSTPGAHTVQFKVDLPADFSAPAGRFVTVSVPIGERQALLVPRTAVRETGQLTGVFIVDQASTARFRLVKTAPFDENRLEILSGIEPGELFLSSPGSEILDGTPLEVRR
jgi:HlyD family secretion protein